MADEDEGVDELLDRLLAGRKPEEILKSGGLVDELTKRLVERALEGELTDHLGYGKHAPEGRNRGNSRNGRTPKRVKTATRELALEVPRDRAGTFEPKLVEKGQRQLPGFDEKVIALYARGDDDAGDPGPPEGAVPGGGLSVTDLDAAPIGIAWALKGSGGSAGRCPGWPGRMLASAKSWRHPGRP
jgi:hypothetical protein